MKYIFETRMEVRDYECDIQGIVNNANYLHYIEHTRHLFLLSTGASFAEMHHRGVDAVVARMNLQYKVPLRCDDIFISRLALHKKGLTSSNKTFTGHLMKNCAFEPRQSWSVSSMVVFPTAKTITAPSLLTYPPHHE